MKWTIYEKGMRWLIMVNKFLSCIILSFFGLERLNLRKRTTTEFTYVFSRVPKTEKRQVSPILDSLKFNIKVLVDYK